jgi:hypothetical protein
MNEVSSRSHSVFTIIIEETTQILSTQKYGTRKRSKIHFIDLAGSERADMTGATGDTLKEGASCYDESISTLRFAERAKKVKNQAVLNMDPTAKRIMELEAEIERLNKLLDAGGVMRRKTTIYRPKKLKFVVPISVNVKRSVSWWRRLFPCLNQKMRVKVNGIDSEKDEKFHIQAITSSVDFNTDQDNIVIKNFEKINQKIDSGKKENEQENNDP